VTVQEAVSEIVRKLLDLDRKELLAGLPRLAEQDRTWDEWTMELRARIELMAADGVSQDMLNATGALVVAMKARLAEQESVSVTSGEAA
jgi:hypothetical protein